ncbi:cilia- and flagella-associated protein 43-like [Diretmus argenteus]
MDAVGCLEVRWAQGFTNQRVWFVDKETICYRCGNYMVFLNLESKVQSVFKSSGNGISAFTANVNSGIFAFSEPKLNPSIFVYNYPELGLKNELNGTAKLDYTSLALSDGGPYLGCCSSLPDHTITVWNWYTAEPICTQPQSGKDVISLVFNPMSWLQICALGTTSLTVWNIERSGSLHIMKPSVVDLPSADGVTGAWSRTHTQRSGRGKRPQHCVRARLTPTATCWTATSQLYVGCKEGFLLLVDPESLTVSVLFNPTAVDAIPELKAGFQDLALHRDGLITAGKELVLHCLQIKGTQIEITQTWELEEPVTIVIFSPDYETLLLASKTGQIYTYKPSRSEKMVKVLDVLSGNFVAGAVLHTDKNICVSVSDSGELQLWSIDGFCIGSLSLRAKVTSLACCPVAQYAAVGTVSGHVLFIDLFRKQQPRLVHKIHLYRGPVDHLAFLLVCVFYSFDQEGNYLFTGAADSHVYVLDAKPSKRFSVIGYTVVPGPILSLSTQYIRDRKQVKVLALCNGQKDKKHEGRLLTLLTLPVRDLTGPGCIELQGCLSNHILQKSIYEVPHGLQSSVLGVSEFFAYCLRRKALQRFQLPQDTDHLSSEEVVQLKPEQQVEGHPLGPASLVLSPHHSWLASVGRDGLLHIRETPSMERYIEIQCHSYRLGGVRSVSFSADSQTLITAGARDGSLVCTNLRILVTDEGKGNKATQYSQSMAQFLENVLKVENPALSDLPDWSQESPSPTGSKEPQKEEASGGTDTVDVTEQDESYTNLLSATASDPTWLETKQEAAVKAENQQHYETKEQLRKEFKELQDAMHEMMRENENLPENERLELREFNLDVEEQRRLEARGAQEVARVRDQIEREKLANCYLRDVLKREFWDAMKVKDKAVKAFHSEHEVKNYPMKERSEKELEDLLRVQTMRKIEQADDGSQQDTEEKKSNTTSEKEEEEGHKSAALTGSLSAQLGCSNPYLYDQFNLQTTEQKINQITLLQDVIHQIKTAFNTEFEAVYKRKELELKRMKDGNRRIMEIMAELHIKEELWEPSLSDNERPERALTVEDSEIKVERYLPPKQKKTEEERKNLEEQRSLAAKSDNIKQRALADMMSGQLEVKKEDILKTEIPQPEFDLTKPDILWSEEQKRIYKEYEKKRKELSEQQEKYRNDLESEMKKLQTSIKEATERFDDTLTTLFERKVKSDMVICQEELKIANLVYSVHIEEEFRNREVELSLKLGKKLAYKDELGEELNKHKDDVELFRETYDNIVAEDKLLDKGFRKEFFDMRGPIIDHLYKLYKRRPRVQNMRTQTDSHLFEKRPLCGWVASDGLGQMLKAMEELDSPENKPKSLDPSIWERFCLVRRAKVESEHQVKIKALTLAEMQAFLQKRIVEDETVKQEIKNLTDELDGLHKEKNRFLKDIMVQVVVKRGQVEVAPTDLIPDYSDSVLLHRSVVEDLNRTIRVLGEQKVATMVECKDIRKGIIQQEWERKRMAMQIEDLTNKARDIQMFHISNEFLEYLKETDHESSMAKRVSTLEKTIALNEKTHLKTVQHRQATIDQLKRQTAMKDEKNAILDQQIANMRITVAERRHIYEAIAVEENQEAKTEERYQLIVQRRKLEDLARAQAEDLNLLWAELERQRMKSFPKLPKPPKLPKHK